MASAPAKPAVRIFKTEGEHQATLILHPDAAYWKTFVMSTGGNGVDHMDVEDGKYVIAGRRLGFTNRSGFIR